MVSWHHYSFKLKKTVEISNLLKDYNNNISKNLSSIIEPKITYIANAIYSCWKNNNIVFLAGNGGSASNAIHLANDLTYGAGKINGKGISSEALCSNQSVITCLGNDIGYENIYSEQIKVKANKGDILILYSGSGNSQNILNAINQAKKLELSVYGIVGFDGGKMINMIDDKNLIHFNLNDMQVVEDLMMIVNHIIIKWLSKKKV